MGFLAPKVNMTTRADKIASFQSTACEFGSPLPIAYGTCKMSPNLINYQDFTTNEIRTTVKTGKRSKSTTIDYDYYVYAELAMLKARNIYVFRITNASQQVNNYISRISIDAITGQAM